MDITSLLHEAKSHLQSHNYSQALSLLDEILCETHENEALKSGLHQLMIQVGLEASLKKDLNAAQKFYEKALFLKPDDIQTMAKLANVLTHQKKWEEAICFCQKSLMQNPDFHEAHLYLGLAFGRVANPESAIFHNQKFLEIEPNNKLALTNYASTKADLELFDDALKALNSCLKIDANYQPAHLIKALILLKLGDFKNGWDEYEWRLPNKIYQKPKWDGKIHKDKTLLIDADQGLGDSIQMIRYIPLLKNYFKKIIVVSQKPLISLFQRLSFDAEIISNENEVNNYDFYERIMSLKKYFDEIPDFKLKTDSKKNEKWKKLFSDYKKLKIGVCWQGNSHHEKDKTRSIPFEKIKPLFELDSLEFFNLQQNGSELNNLISKNEENFDDLASAISHLDLVITVDTSIAHLAASLSVKTWLLLSFNGDFRWLLNKNTSDWYPTLKIFRQNKFNCWDDVIEEVKSELELF